ncbi:glycosyltransferase family 39 protein [Candidatus Woesearchaeota archaeon]|nr:glycosyltransferase family 39 protein [Candidatus Woesearchaeota archaeon]
MGGRTDSGSQRKDSRRNLSLVKLFSQLFSETPAWAAYLPHTIVVLVILLAAWLVITGTASFPSTAALVLLLAAAVAHRLKRPDWLLVPLVALIGVVIRIQNLPLLKGQYPLALDPFIFLRYARELVENGAIPAVDTLRYVPLGFETGSELLSVSYMSAWLYKLLSPLIPGLTIEFAHIIYPVIFFALGIVVFYLLCRELFDSRVAFTASLILSVFPAYLYRTMAGFADKEALGILLMFLSIYLFVLTQKRERRWQAGLFGALSGIAAGGMGLTWGGTTFLYMIVGAYAFALIFLGKMRLRETIALVSWAVPAYLMVAFLTPRYGGIVGVLSSLNFAIPFLALLFLIADRLTGPLTSRLHQAATAFLKDGWQAAKTALGQKEASPSRISPHVLVLLLVMIGGIGALVLLGPEKVFGIIVQIKEQILHPVGTGRLTVTVAENRQPYFSDWWEQFGYFFYFFFIGSMYLFYRMVAPIKRYRVPLTLGYVVFITLFIFSRNRAGTVLNGVTPFSAFLFFGSVIGFALLFYALIIRSSTRDDASFRGFAAIPSGLLLTLIWFIIMILAARGAMRLFFVFSPVIALVAGYLIVDVITRSFAIKDRIYKWTALIIVLVLVVPTVYGMWETSYAQARYTGPSLNDQWQAAMAWVREGTPEDAVFAHWWDYGYWVQAEGRRATILDGGNFISYWNHLMGRHVLSGRSETEALEFLKAHDATHLLVISDEIGKYTAYSSIGSDEEFDIFSWIGTFVMEPRATREADGLSWYTYYGVSALDEQLTYEGKTFPANAAAIGLIQIPIRYDEDDPDEFAIEQPTATVYYQSDRMEVPIECLFFEGERRYFEKEGLGGCIRLMPRYLNAQYQQENGALLWVSERGFGALWTRLFLFDEESERFTLVYDDSDTRQLAYYGGRIMGPLKIWEITYPEGFGIPPELRELYTNRTTNYWEYLNENNRNSPYVQE